MRVCRTNQSELKWVNAYLIFQRQADLQAIPRHRSGVDAGSFLTLVAGGKELLIPTLLIPGTER